MNTRIAATLDALKRHEALVMAPFEAAQEEARKKRNAGVRKYARKRWQEDVVFRITRILRTRLGAVLKAQGQTRSRRTGTSATKRMLGCSVAELVVHLTKLFQPGMTWENYGEWEIDHKKPCRAFDLAQHSAQFECFHYTNLCPIWKTDNRRKSCKWNEISAKKMPRLV